ncbi:MAG: S8 family serine peptidase [bacterium]
MKKSLVAAVLSFQLFLIPPVLARGQQQPLSGGSQFKIFSYQDSTGQTIGARVPANVLVNQIANNGRVVATAELDMSEVLRVIVALKGAPVLKAKTSGPDASSATIDIESQQRRLRADVESLESRLLQHPSGEFPVRKSRFGRAFREVFNGVALESSRKVVEAVKRLPYVKRVYRDVEVQVLLSESVPLIRADAVWSQFGVKGDGMLIGVIDTGVDYHHPALGGGFGPAYKVVGGYDFVNDDADPMDDNGHGTLVSGILAADGDSLQGVAPHARLLAFKVADANGAGIMSDIIAAIEMALDPDGDPNTDDGVDVINISLGSAGHADDPASQAVDNAVDAGVVCVVAAGNDGGHFAIRSPGTARKAITVGASNKSDEMAGFSSNGPNPMSFEIKPEVVAPGVAINTTKLNGGLSLVSGTSMAAPHVAGAAALLLQLHPEWSPETVKSVLMESSKNLSTDLFAQGSGRIDLLRAATLQSVVVPASVSFGLADSRQDTWSKTAVLKIQNLGQVQKSYAFSISRNLPAGVSVLITPEVLTLAPGESQLLSLALNVDNSTVPMVGDAPYAYSGAILAASAADTLKVPFAFIKSPQLNITFDEGPWWVVIHNRRGEVRDYIWPGLFLSDLFPADTYDILVYFEDGTTQVVKEGLSLDNLHALTISKSEAVYDLTIVPIDEEGNTIPVDDGIHLLRYKNSGLENRLNGPLLKRRVSPISSAYSLEWSVAAKVPPDKVYQFNGHADGISRSLVFQNEPSDLTHVTYQYASEPGTDQLFVLHWISRGPEGKMSLTSWDVNDPPLVQPFLGEGYYMSLPFSEFSLGYNFKTVYKYTGPPFDAFAASTYKMFETPRLKVEQDSAEGYLLGATRTPVFRAQKQLNVGLNPPHWFGKFANAANEIELKPALGTRLWFFLTQMSDLPLQDHYTYELFQNEKLVAANIISNVGQSDATFSLAVTPGVYTIEFPYDRYYVGSTQGHALVAATFNTLATDKNPPYLTSFNLLSNDQVTNLFDPGATVKVVFSVQDDHGLNKVEVYYRTAEAQAWRSLIATKSDSLYTAQIPEQLDSEFISLKLSAQDFDGNRLDYTLEPACEIVQQPAPFLLLQPANFDTVASPTPRFEWQDLRDPQEGTVAYSLDFGTDSTLADDSLTNHVAQLPQTSFVVPDSLLDNTMYYWAVAAVDSAGTQIWRSPETWHFWVNYVNDAPVMKPLPDTSFANNATLVLDLNAFAFDPDNSPSDLRWNAFDQEPNIVSINDSTNVATFSAPNFIGLVEVILTVEDPQGLSDSDTLAVSVLQPTGVADDGNAPVPTEFRLHPNYPNPFNPLTTIRYDLPADTYVSVTVYNVLGKAIRRLTDQKKPAGRHATVWDGTDDSERPVASGVYIVTLQAGNFAQSRKILLLR